VSDKRRSWYVTGLPKRFWKVGMDIFLWMDTEDKVMDYVDPITWYMSSSKLLADSTLIWYFSFPHQNGKD
jgi:hypothetical protein